MNANDLKPDSRFFGLIVGESSTGKDCLIASFPKPMLILDSDLRKGIMSAKKWIGEEEFKKIEILSFPPSKGFADYDKELLKLGALFTANSCGYKTIVLNSITTMSRLFMTDAFEYLGGNTVGQKDQTGKITGKIMRMSGPPDYKYEKAAFLTVLDYVRSFPCHVILVGHTVPKYVMKDSLNEYSERVQEGTRLSLTERLANDLLIYFDEVYETAKSADGRIHYVQFRTSIARTCYDSLPKERLDITNKSFFNEWLRLVAPTKAQTPNP